MDLVLCRYETGDKCTICAHAQDCFPFCGKVPLTGQALTVNKLIIYQSRRSKRTNSLIATIVTYIFMTLTECLDDVFVSSNYNSIFSFFFLATILKITSTSPVFRLTKILKHMNWSILIRLTFQLKTCTFKQLSSIMNLEEVGKTESLPYIDL